MTNGCSHDDKHDSKQAALEQAQAVGQIKPEEGSAETVPAEVAADKDSTKPA